MSRSDRSRSPSRQREEAEEVINANVVLPAVIERNEMDDSPDHALAEEEAEGLQDQPAPDIAIESLLGGTPEQFDVSFAAIIKNKNGASHDCGALHRCQYASFPKGHHRRELASVKQDH